MFLGMLCSALEDRLEHLDKLSTCPVKVKGDVDNGSHLYL